MQNSRRNRGTLIQQPTHYATQNDGRATAANPTNTPQQCHKRGPKTTHPTYEAPARTEHRTMDRNTNTAANITPRAAPRVVKARTTREKNRKLQPQQPLKTPVARNPLKHPGRDRTKNTPTPKTKNHRLVSKEANLPSRPARTQTHSLEASALADQDTRSTLETSTATLKQDNTAYEHRPRPPFDTT